MDIGPQPSYTFEKWPEGLVALWDFHEAAAPFSPVAGSCTAKLVKGQGAVTKVVGEGPFGSAAVFDGASYLYVPSAMLGELNVAKYGNSVSVLAWVKRGAANTSFIGGIWSEYKGDPRRSYGLFLSLPRYGGDQRVCGHISRTGAATPGYEYSIDYSASARALPAADTDYRMVGMTYDGQKIISYIDGQADAYPSYQDEKHATYAKNPYLFSAGMNTNSDTSFTVGSNFIGSWGSLFKGHLGGLAVFKTALSPQEMARLHRLTRRPGQPLLKFTWESLQYHQNTESYVSTIGWKEGRGPTLTSTYGQPGAQNFDCVTFSGNNFIIRAGNSSDAAANADLPGVVLFDHLRGLNFSHYSSAQFLLNNSNGNDSVRFCVRIGNQWYATEETCKVNGDGRTSSDWSRAELKKIPFSLAPHVWRSLEAVPGRRLQLGAPVTAPIPDGELTGVGFYNDHLTNASSSILRIGTLTLY